MDCRALTNDRLLDHADGIPDPAAARHLARCPACADCLADLRAIALSLRGLGLRKRTSPFRIFALVAAGLLMILVPIGTSFEVKSVPIETNYMKGPAAQSELQPAGTLDHWAVDDSRPDSRFQIPDSENH